MMAETDLINYDYDPVLFLRCHSKSDVDTEKANIKIPIWQVCFEPKREPKLVATCGGNRICLIDLDTREVEQRYSGEIKEILYALAWNTVHLDGKKRYILATGGALNVIYFLYPREQKQLAHFSIPKKTKSSIYSLLFHPDQKNILFCAMNQGGVHVIYADLNDMIINILGTFSQECEISRITMCDYTLLAATDVGLCGWNLEVDNVDDLDGIRMWRYRLPKNPYDENSDGFDLVDSVEFIGDGFVATKCANHGLIYIWNKYRTQGDSDLGIVDVTPLFKLKWSNTDNYFMEISVNYDIGLLSCGDDEGAIWLYDVGCVKDCDPVHGVRILEPVGKLEWPVVNDVHLIKSRKLDLDRHDIVISKAVIHPNASYIVAITNNNTVCIWKKC